MSKSGKAGAKTGVSAAGQAAPRPIIIRREDAVEAGHHGGAWKVAYADFVTAMMAFFLLMWLLNATTEEQRKGLADYFSPSNLMARNVSGSGAPFGGHTPYDDGTLVSDRGAQNVVDGKEPPVDDVDQDDSDTVATEKTFREPGDATKAPRQPGHRLSAAGTANGNNATSGTAGGPNADVGSGKAGGRTSATDAAPPPTPAAAVSGALASPEAERAALVDAAKHLREAIQSDPALAPLARQLAVDITPEGLRIQILDADQQPMFAFGSAAPNDRARMLIARITPTLASLPEPVSIAGHTDATPYRGTDRTNWELSADRANATRRILLDAGLADARIRTVTGYADRELLLPADPTAAANRRIAITVLRKFPIAPPVGAASATGPTPAAP